jgi:hypothetical protein
MIVKSALSSYPQVAPCAESLNLLRKKVNDQPLRGLELEAFQWTEVTIPHQSQQAPQISAGF